MNIFALLSLVAFALCLFLGFSVYYQDKKKPVNRMFLLLCGSLAYWAFTEFMYRQADTPSTAFFWIKANSLWYFSIAFLIHFALLYTEKIKVFKNRLIYLLIYAPALLFFCIELTHITVYIEPVKVFWGYSYNVPEDSFVYLMSTIWAATAGFFLLVLCIRHYFKVTDTKIKKQTRFVVFGFSIPVFFGSITEVILPAVQIRIPELTVISFIGLCMFVGYSIQKYQLFVLTPTTTINNIIATMPDTIFLTDINGNILKINSSLYNLLEFKEEELIGKSITILFEDEQFGNTILQNLLEQKTVNNYETQYKKKSGEGIDIIFSGSVINDDKGNILGIIGVAYDITERKDREKQLNEKIKKLREREIAILNIMDDFRQTINTLKETKSTIELQNIQLKKLDRIKSDFLNITSHELRTPMSAIKGYVQMVIKQKLGQISEEQRQALNVVLRNTDRLDNLIRDILDVSRLESGTMKFVPEKTNPGKMVAEAVETMQPTAKLKNIKIDTEIEYDIPELMVDPERIKQVIINIVNNAIKFSPNGTIINLRTKKEKDQILFEIQDHGRGIPTDKQGKIFEIFYQIDSGMDRKFGGAGLGLAISRGIVLSHGGNIWVESEPEKGSTFRFTLPTTPVQDVEGKFRDVDIFRLKEKKFERENVLRDKILI